MESQMKSLQNLSNQVLDFINGFKEKHSQEIEDVFSNGYCYWFATILNLRFGILDSSIYYLPIKNHFITKIEDKFYDITGEIILDEEPYLWCVYKQFDYLEYERIKRDCILKEKI